MHATSQALHPMQLVTSISLATFWSRCMPLPGMLPGCADMAWICNVFSSAIGLRPLHFHQEALELWRIWVGIGRRRRKLVDIRERSPTLVFGDAAEAAVDGDADLVGLLAVDHHRLDAARDHGFGDVMAARAGDLQFFAAAD